VNIPTLGDTVTCIRYHVWWPSSGDPFYQANIPENTARTNFYGVGGVPNARVDGIINAGSNYSMWGNFIRGRAVVDAPVDLELQGYYAAPNGMVRVLAEVTDFLAYSDLRLFVILTEDSIFYAAKYYSQTMRDMIPTSSGDPVTLFSPGDTLLREYNYTVDGAWDGSKVNVVVVLQDYTSKEVIQVASTRITLLGVEEGIVREAHPVRLALSDGFPSPFRDRTRIEYTIPSAGHVDIRVYDSAGNLVRTLLSGTEVAGTHLEHWDGRDDSGRELASGVYFSRLSFGGESRVSRVSLIR
jgi:hypothetical protein